MLPAKTFAYDPGNEAQTGPAAMCVQVVGVAGEYQKIEQLRVKAGTAVLPPQKMSCWIRQPCETLLAGFSLSFLFPL